MLRFGALVGLDRNLPLRSRSFTPIHVLVGITFGLVAIALHEILLPIAYGPQISLGFGEIRIGGENESAARQCLQQRLSQCLVTRVRRQVDYITIVLGLDNAISRQGPDGNESFRSIYPSPLRERLLFYRAHNLIPVITILTLLSFP